MNPKASDAMIAAERDPGEADLRSIVIALWNGKWLIMLCAAAFLSLGAYYVYKVAVPMYAASARLVLQIQNQNVIDIESVATGVSADFFSLNTEVEVMSARELVERLVTELELTKDPDFNPYLVEVEPGPVDRLILWLREQVGMAPEPLPPPTEQDQFMATVRAVNGAIRIVNERSTYIFRITVTTVDREKSALLANTLARIYLDEQIRTKFSATEFAVNWLSERVSDLELELNEKTNQIKALELSSGLMETAALEALRLRARDLRRQFDERRGPAIEDRAFAADLRALVDQGDYDIAADLIDTPQAAELAAEIEAGVAGARDEFDTLAEDRAADAERRAAAFEARLSASLPTLERLESQIESQENERQELELLIREAEATRVLYETFLARLKETSVQIGLQQADSRILTEALPGSKVAPRGRRIMALTMFLGILLGVALVYLGQQLRSGFRTVDELERTLGQTVMGLIPKLPYKKRRGLIDYLKKNPTSAAAEAIRNIRTSLLLSSIDRPPKVTLVTSSVPGEGKTTVSIALAYNLSGLGKRVLLVEGDIRRRTLREYLDPKSDGDIIKVLSGTYTMEEAVTHDPNLGIDVLMGGKTRVNAADLFSSDSFGRFIKEAREAYDYIVIDTPPVLIVPDARVLGRHADSILYSVRWNRTPQNQVKEGLRQLTSVNLQVSGIVMSIVDIKKMGRYTYGGRYGAYSKYGHKYYNSD